MSCVWSPDDDDGDYGGSRDYDDGDDDGDYGDDDNSDDDDHLLVMTDALLGAQRGNWNTIIVRALAIVKILIIPINV